MPDQQKIRRMLRLLLMLSGGRSYSRAEIAERIGIDERSVYRYFNTFEAAGLVIHREGGYRLVTTKGVGRSLSGLFHFSEEEAYVLYNLLENADGDVPTKQRLLSKLHALYDFNALVQLEGQPTLTHVLALKKAITDRRRVVLKAYRSSSSQTIQDRVVEPFCFLPDYNGVWCFDLGDQKNKQFRLSRIYEVTLLPERWIYEEHHQVYFTDAFRMSAPEPIGRVAISFNLRVYNLLREEFPLAMEQIKRRGNKYVLDIDVADYHGIGRFVLGLPGEVEVLGSEAFQNFLKGKMNYLKESE